MPGIWTSFISHYSIFWPIDWVFGIDFVISRRPEITALLTAFPRATMLVLIVRVTQTKAFVLDLTPPAASQRHKRRIATYPLLTTRGLHSRRLGIATEPAMRAGNRLGFHAVVRHGVAFSGGVGGFSIPRARFRGASRGRSLYAMGSWSSLPEAARSPWPVDMEGDERASCVNSPK